MEESKAGRKKGRKESRKEGRTEARKEGREESREEINLNTCGMEFCRHRIPDEIESGIREIWVRRIHAQRER